MSTLSVGTIKSISSVSPVFKNASGTEKGQLCLAWVNFNGEGTLTTSDQSGVRDSFNISSVIDEGSGKYTVNFSTAMLNANYCVCLGVKSADSTNRTYATLGDSNQNDPSTTAFQILTERTSTGSDTDAKYVMASVFGDS